MIFLKDLKLQWFRCACLEPEVLASPQPTVFHNVDIINDHPEDPTLVHLHLEPQVMHFSVLEGVRIH